MGMLRFRRHQQIYRAFSAIARLILWWGEENGAISREEGERYFSLWVSIITLLMKENEDMAIVAAPWQQFIVALQTGIGTGGIVLAYNKEEYEDNAGKFLGYKRRGKDGECEYVFVPETAFAYVRSHIQSTGKELVDKPTAIYRDLCENGIARGYKTQANGKNTRNRYLKRIMLRKFYRVKELVELLGVSKSMVYEYVYANKIPAKRLGRRILIPEQFVRDMLLPEK